MSMILNRYILREFFRYASGTVILCIFFFILFDFIQKTAGYLGKYNPSARVLLEYYLMQIPFEIYQAIPIASLISSVVTMVLLARSGETTAMQAAGMGPFRIVVPIAFGGLILSFLSFFLGEFVIPYTAHKAHYIKQVTMEKENSGLNEGAYWVRSPNRAVNFRGYNPSTQTLNQVKILDLSPNDFSLVKSTHAKTADYLASDKLWVLKDIREVHFDHNRKLLKTLRFPSLSMALPLEPKNLVFDRRAPYELSLPEIRNIINTGQQANGDILSYRIAWHMKFAYPFAAFLISFLGLRFGYVMERTSETIRGMFLALVLALSYWFVLSASKALCSSGSLHPFFAGWLANLWISMIVIWQILHVDRGARS